MNSNKVYYLEQTLAEYKYSINDLAANERLLTIANIAQTE